jgi:hypothetical protein
VLAVFSTTVVIVEVGAGEFVEVPVVVAVLVVGEAVIIDDQYQIPPPTRITRITTIHIIVDERCIYL